MAAVSRPAPCVRRTFAQGPPAGAAGSRPAGAEGRSALSISPQRPRGRNSAKRMATTPRSRHVPDAVLAELVLQDEEQHRSEDRPLERAEAADQRHQDHVGGPLHAEIGLRLEGDRGREPEHAGQRAAERRQDEHGPLGGENLDAERGRRLLVVADRLHRGAERAAQQDEDRAEQDEHRGERQPVVGREPLLHRVKALSEIIDVPVSPWISGSRLTRRCSASASTHMPIENSPPRRRSMKKETGTASSAAPTAPASSDG